MARKNLTDVIAGSPSQSAQPHPVGNNSKQRATKYYHNTNKYFKAITPAPMTGKNITTSIVESEQQSSPVPRSSPRNIPSSHGKTSPNGSPKQASSPRTSPGLLGRHYAGCKFSEPPAPTMLPLPPQHWTLSSSVAAAAAPVRYYYHAPNDGAAATLNQQQQCLSQQLKVLLKVQA